ncbi:MAG: hypothetical protein HOV79_26535 [Hamadaea sp.]|nr:hypothetical protein [Hamadaea sp.]
MRTDRTVDGMAAIPLGREDRIKYLELIQAVIARLANNSFFMKGWGLTVTGAIYGFAASDLNWRVSAVGLLPALAFWFLDSYFLRQERMFRRLYEDARHLDDRVDVFSLDIRRYVEKEPWLPVVFSMTLAPFYGLVLCAGLALTLIAAYAI